MGSEMCIRDSLTVIDHGIASVELVMEEALQDIPTLVQDIQERLKRLSESVAVDGKPRPGLPNRRLLWDILKPQASTVSQLLLFIKQRAISLF